MDKQHLKLISLNNFDTDKTEKTSLMSLNIRIHLPLILLLGMVLLNSCSLNDEDKHPEINYFPEFNTTAKNIHLQQLSEEEEHVRRVYPTRDHKQLLVLSQLRNDTSKNYRLKVYDKELNLVKKIDAPELNGLFGIDDMGDLYAGKGYFKYNTYEYRPIHQLWVTDHPQTFGPLDKDTLSKANKPLIMDFETLSNFPKRGDTLLSFQRKDYKGSYFYLKKSSLVYEIIFKDCSYCEGKFNRAESISEYRAEENGVKSVIRPYDGIDLNMWHAKPLFYYKLQLGDDEVFFKVRYADNARISQIKRTDFAGKSFIFYESAADKTSRLYLFNARK